MERISVTTSKRTEFIDITQHVRRAVAKTKIKDGICCVFSPHTTAGLTINENADPSVKLDIIKALEEIVPVKRGYLHSEGNSDSHIKASLLGSSLNIIICSGELSLGTWQGVYFSEFDGPRSREVWVKVVNSV